MKNLILLLFLLPWCGSTWARERNLAEKQKAAASVLNKVASKRSVQEIVPLQCLEQLTVMGYEDGDGFAVIANDDAITPILGYSHTTFDATQMPDGLQWWMQATNRAIAARPSETKQADFQEIIRENNFAPSVPAIITAEWGQEAPFNQMCPVSPVTGVPSPTGCIATAMAQIMQHYQWPLQGTGSYSYEWIREDQQTETLEADFGSTTYDWSLMPDNFDYPTNEQTDAVAQLMYHCGVAVGMLYASYESGAYEEDVIRAMSDHFGYSPNLQIRYRDKYSIADWMFLVMRELNAGRPILYTGQTPEYNSHAFIVDGYGTDGLVHVNWGWTGLYNGMYDISLLNPADRQYSEGQSMLIGIAPEGRENLPYYAELYIYESEFEVSFPSYLNLGTTIRMYNGSQNTEHGTLAILLKGENGYFREWTSKHTPSEGLEPWGNLLLTSAMYLPVPEDLPDGTYRVYAAFRRDGEEEWIRPRYDIDKKNECILIKNGEECTAEGVISYEGLANDPTVTSLPQTFADRPASDSHVHVYDLAGRCIYSAPNTTFNIKDIRKCGIYLIRQGNHIKKVRLDGK